MGAVLHEHVGRARRWSPQEKNFAASIADLVALAFEADERKRAEEAFKESEERFRILANSAPMLLWMSRTDALRSFFNKPWLDFTGRTLEQELGNCWAEGVHPDDYQRCSDIYLGAFHARQPFSMDYRLRRADGEYRWVFDTGVPRYLSDGTFAGYIGSAIDITDRKRAEDDRRDALAREHAARAEAETSKRRAALLAEASNVLASRLDYAITLQTLARLTVAELADLCVVDLLEEDGSIRRVAAAHANPAMQEAACELQRQFSPDPRGQHPVAKVLRTGRPDIATEIHEALLNDIAPELGHLEIARGLTYRSYIVVPLVARGRILGALSLVSGESRRRYTAADLELAEELGRRAAMAVDNARLYATSEQRRWAAETLADVARLISASLEPQDVTRRIADSVLMLLRAQNASLFLVEPTSGDLVTVAVSGDVGPASGPDMVFPHGIGLIGLAVREQRPVATSDVLTDPRLTFTPEVRALVERDMFRSILAIPLIAKGKVSGALRVADRLGRVFDNEDIQLAKTFADHAAIAQENSRLYAEAEELAANRERLRVARELHDTLSQVLFSIALKLDWCLHRADPRVRRKLQDIRRETGSMMEQIRNLIAKLSEREDGAHRPFAERLQLLLKEFGELTGIAVELVECDDTATLGQPEMEILLKTFLEALANISKHARATRATIRLKLDGDVIHFEVADDGIGPPGEAEFAQRVGGPRHFGLRQMRERIETAGGRLEIGPNAPSGFRLWGSLPLEVKGDDQYSNCHRG